MGQQQVVMFEEEQQQIQTICDRLQRDSNSIAILVINKDGQEIARSGSTENLDVTSLSSLFAGNVATMADSKLFVGGMVLSMIACLFGEFIQSSFASSRPPF